MILIMILIMMLVVILIMILVLILVIILILILICPHHHLLRRTIAITRCRAVPLSWLMLMVLVVDASFSLRIHLRDQDCGDSCRARSELNILSKSTVNLWPPGL